MTALGGLATFQLEALNSRIAPNSVTRHRSSPARKQTPPTSEKGNSHRTRPPVRARSARQPDGIIDQRLQRPTLGEVITHLSPAMWTGAKLTRCVVGAIVSIGSLKTKTTKGYV